jgi:hypothetical protein
MSERYEGAIVWARRGYRVFPLCDPGEFGKRPRITGWQDRATTDESTIDRWWLEWPDANIGMAIQSYEFVLDADGPEQMRWVESNLPQTLTVSTGRQGGGAHYIFDVPVDLRLRNRTVCFDVAGLEGKTHGKLVVAPGSVHHSGKRYAVRDDADPEVLPGWAIERIGLYQPNTSGHSASPSELARWALRHEACTPAERRRGEVTYQRAVRRLRRDLPVTEGWATLFHVHARRVGEFVARGAYTYDDAVTALMAVFVQLDDGRGGEKGRRHVLRSIERGVAIGAREAA